MISLYADLMMALIRCSEEDLMQVKAVQNWEEASPERWDRLSFQKSLET